MTACSMNADLFPAPASASTAATVPSSIVMVTFFDAMSGRYGGNAPRAAGAASRGGSAAGLTGRRPRIWAGGRQACGAPGGTAAAPRDRLFTA